MTGVATTCWVLAPSPKLLESRYNSKIRPPHKHRSETWRIRKQQASRFGRVSLLDVSSSLPNPSPAMEERVKQMVLKQLALYRDEPTRDRRARLMMNKPPQLACGNDVLAWLTLNEAYKRCAEALSGRDDKVIHLGTMLMRPEQRRSILALAVWCRRTDELVDGPNAAKFKEEDMEAWEKRLQDVFDGRPHDVCDLALADTISKYALDIQPFRDLITGMRMDMGKTRYMNFDELYLYSYYVAAAVALMCWPILGIPLESKASTESISEAIIAAGVAAQLTDILQDISEDATRGRIYLPLDELEQAGLAEDDIFHGRVTNKWKSFMKEQVKRTRKYYTPAAKLGAELDFSSRLPMTSALLTHKQILDAIEANDYDNLSKKADVGKVKKLLSYVEALWSIITIY